jgi:lysozyme
MSLAPVALSSALLALFPTAASATGVNASANQPVGPDVSHYQGHVNWGAVVAGSGGGIGFAIAKATEGTSYVDPQFKANWAGMKSSGIRVRGAYHFGRPGTDATAQAAHFVSTVGGSLAAGEFAVLDIETADSQSPSSVAKWSNTFVSTVQAKLKVPPSRVFVYTGAWFWNPQAGGGKSLPSSFFKHPLWVAGYVPSKPPMPAGWSSWTVWQYTDKDSIAGISGNVDCSRFQGTQAELERLVGGGGGPSPAPPPPHPPPPPAGRGGYCRHDSPANKCGRCPHNAESECGHHSSSGTAYCKPAKDPKCPGPIAFNATN